ncbi:Serine/threonine-protein kinase env7 [Blastocladiella emersonii ATCC 22665]|nr:Serine/threonine-protein kinase env7 [Blastocladiella emersonii ATCC 22665]
MDALVQGFRHLLFALYRAVDKNNESSAVLNERKLLYSRKIAEGGFGTVYLVRDLSVPGERLWALKKVAAGDSESRDAFHHEVQAHNAVGMHPNVMRVIASGLAAGATGPQGFILMPFYRNGNLQDFVELRTARNQPLSAELITSFLKSMCQGLLAFHSQDPPLALRDIKPANMLIGDDGQSIVLTDLGSVGPAVVVVANRAQANAKQDEFATTITAPFRAPECFSVPSACTLDMRTDIWSLGCVLYFMLFGKPAFDGTESSARSTVNYFDRDDNLTKLARAMLQVDMDKRPLLRDIIQQL